MNGVFTSYALEDATKNQKRSFGDVIQTFENKSVNSLSQPKREWPITKNLLYQQSYSREWIINCPPAKHS